MCDVKEPVPRSETIGRGFIPPALLVFPAANASADPSSRLDGTGLPPRLSFEKRATLDDHYQVGPRGERQLRKARGPAAKGNMEVKRERITVATSHPRTPPPLSSCFPYPLTSDLASPAEGWEVPLLEKN